MREKTQHPTVPKIERQIKGKFQPRYPQSPKEEAEFGPGQIDVLICKKCRAAYWYKSWHHQKDLPKRKYLRRIDFTLCPACRMIRERKYEGEIILEKVPERFKKEILNLIKNYGQRAFKEDPLDRIISVKERKIKRATAKEKRGRNSRREIEGQSQIRILTTENQLAKRLAQKIYEICGGKLDIQITHSHRESTARVRISF